MKLCRREDLYIGDTVQEPGWYVLYGEDKIFQIILEQGEAEPQDRQVVAFCLRPGNKCQDGALFTALQLFAKDTPLVFTPT